MKVSLTIFTVLLSVIIHGAESSSLRGESETHRKTAKAIFDDLVPQFKAGVDLETIRSQMNIHLRNRTLPDGPDEKGPGGPGKKGPGGAGSSCSAYPLLAKLGELPLYSECHYDVTSSVLSRYMCASYTFDDVQLSTLLGTRVIGDHGDRVVTFVRHFTPVGEADHEIMARFSGYFDSKTVDYPSGDLYTSPYGKDTCGLEKWVYSTVKFVFANATYTRSNITYHSLGSS